MHRVNQAHLTDEKTGTIKTPFPFIFLYGPSGSGKTTLARRLAKDLSMLCIDLDEEIELENGQSVRDIFAQYGERVFRKLEKKALQRVLSGQHGVVALGGGALLDTQNRLAVEAAGRVVCLSASVEVLLRRLSKESGKRPLLESVIDNEGVESRLLELLSKRKEHYASFPLCLDTTIGSPMTLAHKIQKQLGYFFLLGMGGLSASGYSVLVKSGSLHMLGEYLERLGLGGPVAVVADQNVAKLYAGEAVMSLREAGYKGRLISIDPGESHKTLATIEKLWEGFLGANLERRSTVVALGGGVTCDLAGFAAATYLRGVRWVAMPTTLLAMVDASLGGKTGFDLPQGKNLIGAFYPPSLVLADPQSLTTLSARELRAGMAEVVKAGLIADPLLFELCCQGWQVISERLEEVINHSIAVKARIVQTDPFEQGDRAALNLGHTIGHAVEVASNYELLHGEAIAIGLVAESRLAERIGLARIGLSERIAGCLSKLGLPIEIPAGLSIQNIVKAATVDKKRLDGNLRFVLPQRPGRVQIGVVISQWEEMLEKR